MFLEFELFSVNRFVKVKEILFDNTKKNFFDNYK